MLNAIKKFFRKNTNKRKRIEYEIHGAGVLYQDSDKYLRSEAGKKAIQDLKKLDAIVKKQRRNK